MSSEERGRSSYLDLLIATLMDHEKKLDTIVEKIEKTCGNLQNIYDKTKLEMPKKTDTDIDGKLTLSNHDILIYMKIKLDRDIEDIKQIIEILKE